MEFQLSLIRDACGSKQKETEEISTSLASAPSFPEQQASTEGNDTSNDEETLWEIWEDFDDGEKNELLAKARLLLRVESVSLLSETNDNSIGGDGVERGGETSKVKLLKRPHSVIDGDIEERKDRNSGENDVEMNGLTSVGIPNSNTSENSDQPAQPPTKKKKIIDTDPVIKTKRNKNSPSTSSKVDTVDNDQIISHRLISSPDPNQFRLANSDNDETLLTRSGNESRVRKPTNLQARKTFLSSPRAEDSGKKTAVKIGNNHQAVIYPFNHHTTTDFVSRKDIDVVRSSDEIVGEENKNIERPMLVLVGENSEVSIVEEPLLMISNASLMVNNAKDLFEEVELPVKLSHDEVEELRNEGLVWSVQRFHAIFDQTQGSSNNDKATVDKNNCINETLVQITNKGNNRSYCDISIESVPSTIVTHEDDLSTSPNLAELIDSFEMGRKERDFQRFWIAAMDCLSTRHRKCLSDSQQQDQNMGMKTSLPCLDGSLVLTNSGLDEFVLEVLHQW